MAVTDAYRAPSCSDDRTRGPVATHVEHAPRLPRPTSIVIGVVVMLLVVLLGTMRRRAAAGPRAPTRASHRQAPNRRPRRATPRPRRPAIPTPSGPTILGSTVRFHGRGYGHGVGLSQNGAKGRAIAGEDAATILAHYYQGATLGSIPTTTRIRVRVLYRWRATPTVPLLVFGRRAAWTIDGVAATFPADASLRVVAADHRRDDDLADPGDLGRRGRAAQGTQAEPVRRPRRDRHDPPPGLVETGHLRRIPRPAPDQDGLDRAARDRRQRPAARDVRARRRPGRDGCDLADRRARGADHRRALIRRASPAARRVLLRHRRHGGGPGLSRSEGREGDHQRHRADDGRRRPAQRLVDRQYPLPLDRGRGDREQRERLHLGDGRQGRRRRQLPPRVERSSAGRDRLRCRLAVRHLVDPDVHRRAAVGLVRRRRADQGRDADRARPPQHAACRAGSSASGSSAPAGRRRCPARSSDPSSMPGRPSTDPMLRSTLFGLAPIP